MKKIFAFLLALIMIFSLCACGNEKPQNEIPEDEIIEKESELIEPEEPEEPEQAKDELYREMLLNFGAAEQEDGSIRANKTASLYNMTQGFEDGTKLEGNDYFCWAMFYFNREYSYEERLELFTGAGENMGWAYPSEYYEPAVYKYFGVPAETLRQLEYYNAEKDYYHMGGGGGIGDVPDITVNSIDDNGEKVVFHLTLDYQIGDDCDMALTVKILPDGTYNYASYLPE